MKLIRNKNNSTQSVANVIDIPSNNIFATLLSVNQTEKYFEYKVSFLFDPKKAAKNNSFQVEIWASTTSIDSNMNLNSVANNDNRRIVQNLLKRNVILKDNYRTLEKNVIKTFNVDLGNAIPNDIANRLSERGIVKAKNSSNNNTEESGATLRQETIIVPTSVEELNDQNIFMPVLDSNLNNNSDNALYANNNSVRNDSMNLLYQKLVDPASFVGNKTETLLSAKRTRQGTVVSKDYKRFNHKANHFQENRLIRSLLSSGQTFDQTELPANATVNVLKRVSTERLVVEKIIKIPFDDRIVSEFYLNLRLKNAKGLFVQNISRLVNHSRNVELTTLPSIAPDVQVVKNSYTGEAILGLRQNDPNATKIRLYRRDLNKSQPNVTSEYLFVGEVDLKKEDGFTGRISDPHVSINPTIYRAIGVNGNGTLGAEFGSVVTEAKKIGIVKTNKRSQQPCFVSMNYTMDSSGITVSVKDIPAGAISIELLRKNKTNFQKIYERVGNLTQIDSVSNSSISFTDIFVSKFKIYEYKVRLHYKNGTTQISPSSLLVDFDSVTNNILNLDVDSPQTVNTDMGDINITFNITKNIIQNDTNMIKSFLEAQGFISQFENEILANREKLGNIFAVSVMRFNLTTGELEDFGIIDSNTFSDARYGQPKGIKSLQPGCDYRYTLTAYARDPETLFSTTERVITEGNTPYTLKPQKWRHPVTFQDGNIVSENSLKRNHAYSTFSFGSVVDSKDVNVSLGDILPSIYDSKVMQIAANKTLVEWKVQGNVSKIDHFVIVMESIGIKTIVGKCHNISNSNYFQFVDNLTNGETGEMTYFIVPVFFDYSRGSEAKTNQVVI